MQKLKFLSIKKINLNIGDPIKLDIYLQLSESKAVKILNKNDTFLEEDQAKLKSYKDKKILILKDEYQKLQTASLDSISTCLSNNVTFDPELGKNIAKNVFEAQGEGPKAKIITQKANEVVKVLFDIPSNKRATYLLDLLYQSDLSQSQYSTHANQVSAVSVMIALTQRGLDIDHLTEVSMSAFLHGAGLQALVDPEADNELENVLDFSNLVEIGSRTKVELERIIKKHIDGHHELVPEEEELYLKHMNIVENSLKSNASFKITQGLKRTISDFKGSQNITRIKNVSPHNAYLPSKILLIGDRLVSYMNYYKDDDRCIEKSIEALKISSNDPKSYTLFDHKILDTLESIL